MADTIRFACPRCAKKLQIGTSHAGRAVKCPNCGAEAIVPQSAADPPPLAAQSQQVIYCTACGAQNVENNFRCVKCGKELHESAPAKTRYQDPVLEFIPYRNVASLWAYYLGVFALIPCFGVALGIAAIVMGIIGVRKAQTHPETKGMVHASVGIILGALVLAVHLAGVLIVLAYWK